MSQFSKRNNDRSSWCLTEEVCVPTQENRFELRLCPLLLSSSPDGVHSFDGDLMLPLRSPPSFDTVLGKVREEEVACHREGKSDDAVDDEEPAPCALVSATYRRRREDLQPA
jgi:hypothetical protein